MDAAQTNLKKIALILATALLLTAPFRASAAVPALVSTGTTVTIGSSQCNASQDITITSSDGSNQAFSVAVQYPTNDAFGSWLFAKLTFGGGSTSTSTAFNAQTTTTGVSLTLGLNYGLANNPETATVVLTPADGAPAVNITVFYSQNASCGANTGSPTNNFITLTPGNIGLTAATNGQQSLTITVQNVSGGSYAFTPSVQPANSWLSVSFSALTVSAGGTTTITVTANATQTSGVGNYVGSLTVTPQQGFGGNTINIPVDFTVTNGTSTGTGTGTGNSSGTLTLNGATSNVFTTTFNYVAPNVPGGEYIALQDTAAGANSYSTAVTTSSGGNWLLANQAINTTTLQILAPGSNAYVNLSLSNAVSTLGSGAYQGQVFITSSSGATATLYVNLIVGAGVAPGITVQPGPIFQFNNVAPNSNVAQSQIFTISAASGYTTSIAALSSSAGGFTMTTPVATNNSQSFTITSNSGGLATGLYATTVTMTSNAIGSTSTNTTTITIVLPVGQAGATTTGNNGGSGTSTVFPSTLNFQQQQGNSYWTSGKEVQNVTIVGTPGTQWNASIVYASGNGWMAFESPTSGTFGNTPVTLTVDLFNGVTSLSPSSTPYSATIDITTPNNGLTTATVSLLVTPQSQPVLLAYPASATFSATTGTSTPAQTVTVVGSDNFNPPLNIGTPTATWVSATANGNTMTISVNPTGQSAGVYTATIPVSANAYSNPISYPVVMIVNGGGTGGNTGGTGALTLSTTSLPFTNVTGSLSQNFNVSASTNTQFTVASQENTCNTAVSWLQVNNGSYTATTTATPITVTVNPGSIASGTTCTGVITLVSTGSNSGTQTVNVSMTVGASTGSGNVIVSPTTMTFAYTQNQSVPSAQIATITNALTGTASIPFTVSTAENSGGSVTWLQTSVSLASTPYNSLSVSVAPGNLSPGQYTGTVTITPTGGNQQTIGITLNITSNSVVTATPTNISLNYNLGGNSPTSTILVSAGGSAAGFTATAASSQGWLAVTPTLGITPNTGTFNLTVSVVSTVLNTLLPSSTPYTGSITVAGVSPATGTTIVKVSLTVTAPLPVISSIINAASGATGAVSPGEVISIFAPQGGSNPIGPAASVALSSTTCPNPCTQVPTLMGGVQVKFLPSGTLAPLLYVGSTQINAVVPYEIANQGSLSVEVLYLGQSSNAFSLTGAAFAPGLFASNGSGQAAAYELDPQGNFSYNTATTPAKAGWTIVLYLTGEGVVTPAAATGSVTVAKNTNPPVPVPAVAPTVFFGTVPANVTYGEAPGVVSGILQINVTVPAGAGTGAVPIKVSFGNFSTQTGVTVALQ